jgi:hypothetical protein
MSINMIKNNTYKTVQNVVRSKDVFFVREIIFIRLGTTTSWGIISHLVVNHPYSVPYLPTKWRSFFEKSALHENNYLAHLHEYQGVFSDIVAVYEKKLARLPPSN